MKQQILKLLSDLNYKLLILGGLLFPLSLWAQVPRDIPTDTGPLEVDTTFDIILYIILPLVVIIFFFVYRSARKKKERDRRND